MPALYQSLRKVSTCKGSGSSIDWVLHPWPKRGWSDMASAQFQLPASAAAQSSGPPSSAAGHSLPHSCGCLQSQGLPPSQAEGLPYFLFENKKVKNDGVLGTSLEQPAHPRAGITPYFQAQEKN